jgi:superfamily II DNA or RNA helicase
VSLALVRDIVLRPYQQRAVDDLRQKIASGKKRVVLIAATGSGKTVMAAEVVRLATGKGNRVVFAAHRKELIDQTVDRLAEFGIAAGVIMADDARADSFLPVQVCSVQTMIRRMDRLPPASVVIFDEVHHALSQSWRKVVEAYSAAIVIGLTATPFRTDKFGLRDLFVVVATPLELIGQGALVPYDAFAYDAPELHDVGMVAGEYNQRDLDLACNTKVLVGSAVREYIKHASERPALCFPVSIAHSQSLVAEFIASGVSAEHIDFKTPKDVRSRTLERFRKRELTVISSVGILTEGFDAPVAEVAILCRPTKSLSLHLQMLGRVLRPTSGKSRALYHDHAGNLLRHGMPDDPREWNIENTPQLVVKRHTCLACKRFYVTTKDGCCPHCGAIIAVDDKTCGTCFNPKPCACPKGERSDIAMVDGKRINVAEIRAKRAAAGIERQLTDEQIALAAVATREAKAGEYLRLRAVASSKGFKPGFIAHQYRAVFGHWPKFSDEELQGAPAALPFFPLPRSTFKAPGGWPE